MSFATIGTFATVYRTIGLALLAVVLIATITYVLVNVLFAGKAEIGSEIELAPNRKPYYADEVLEGDRLTRAQWWGLAMLFILAIGLPLYWVMEPGRQENAAGDFGRKFRERGEHMFAATGENANALNCAGCHGGLDGGVAPDFPLSQPDGSIQVVQWRAPQLGTVLLRYSREEVRFILVYGRPGSPMPAWGVDGGGPLNDQQIQNLIDYLDENQMSAEEAQAAVEDELERYMAATFEDGTPVFETEGEALFNMGLITDFAGGAFSCARCHTAGWPYAEVETSIGDDGNIVVNRDDFEAATANTGCGGSLGFNLCDGATERQFPAEDPPAREVNETDEEYAERTSGFHPLQDMIDFVTAGSEDGIGYGRRGQGSGKMPGFGQRPGEPALYWLNGGVEREPSGGMLTAEMIEAIVEFERSLTSTGADGGEG
jgi:mono/diheme cytochrome c family protein